MKKGIDLKNLNPAVAPGEDFYEYACGGWIKAHPLKGEFSRYGTFDMLREQAREQLKDLITGLADTPEAKEKGTNAQKVSDLYNMGMDVERLNRDGVKPLLPMLEKIEAMKKEDFTETLAWVHLGLSNSFFGAGVSVDMKDSDKHMFSIGETGLGLGDRDYYLEENETNAKIMKGYEVYVKRIMTLSGYSEAEAQRIWDNVIKLETRIAEKKYTREQRRNPNLLYNVVDADELKKRYGNIDWDLYFNSLEVKPEKVNLSHPDYMEFIDNLIGELSEREIKDYLLYEAVTGSTGLMGEEFEDASFELYDKLMSGVEEKRPRWKRAMALPNSMFGEAVGELYVNKYFPQRNKEYMIGLVENLRKSLGQHIARLEWMSDETKEKALDKLASLTVKIGYPDKWKDYSEIEIDPEKTYLENVYNASIWFTRDNLKKLDKPVDKDEWHMFPQTVNAYYSPVNNEICFPAAILQPPYFDIDADDALNYGAIGVVIGHEMTHGFDDQGRQFDKNGNLSNWWTEEDAVKFKALTDILVAQFNAVEIAPGVHANGEFTLGENIADQGGLRVALTAYENATAGKEAEKIEGFTPLQRFYLSYAGVWAGSIREEDKLVRTKTDPHSLDKNRVNETLKNIEPFMEAFGIKEGDRMFRPAEERVIIW